MLTRKKDVFAPHDAGAYPILFVHQVRSLSNNVDGLASKEWTYSASGRVYWGALEELGSSETVVDGRLLTKTMARIALRNWVDTEVTPLDWLVDQQFGKTYQVTSVARGSDETLLECFVYETGF